jgi:hypothetical protein
LPFEEELYLHNFVNITQQKDIFVTFEHGLIPSDGKHKPRDMV